MKHHKLNNKGYMLVELILASTIAMAVAYFMIDVTIKLKNRNDDLLVRTLVATDQAIIYNTIMKDLTTNMLEKTCDNVNIEVEGTQGSYYIKYENKKTETTKNIPLNKYITKVNSDDSCKIEDETLNITLGLEVPQLETFNIDIKY